MKRKIIAVFLACLVIFGISSCTEGTIKKQDDEVASKESEMASAESDTATTELIEQYQKEGKYDISSDVKIIKTTDAIELDIMKKTEWTLAPFADFEKHPVTKSYSSSIPVAIFSDYSLTSNFLNGSGRAAFERKDETGKLKIFPADEIKMFNLKDESKTLSATRPNDWGSLNILYLVIYNDLETGKLLEKPKVQIYKIDHSDDELQAPYVTFSINDDGALKLSWNEVENATEYYIIKNTVHGGRINGEISVSSSPQVIATTANINWDSLMIDESVTDSYQNQIFADTTLGIDDNLADESRATETELKRNDTELIDAYHNGTFVSVVAVNAESHSAFSNMISSKDIISKLPYQIARNTKNVLHPYDKPFEKITDIPATMPISMTDGTTKLFPIEISVEDTKPRENFDSFRVVYRIKGTTFEDYVLVNSYDNPNEITRDIEKFNNDAILNFQKTGITFNTFDYSQIDDLNFKKELSKGYVNVEDEIFSTTALGEYLASNMIAGNEFIDISLFTEAVDTNYINDVVSEIIYQNPTIPKIRNIQLSGDNTKILITYYDSDKDIRNKKMEEIREVLDNAVTDIVTEGMSDIEKASAINKYIISTSEYDYGAYEMKKKYGVSKEYSDAFHAYGIAVKNLGVCLSYAQTFNYMAKKAGLDVITVTGYVHGNQDAGHAWNAIKIGEQWNYFDSTWNDSNNPDNQEKYFNLEKDDDVMSTHTLDEYGYIVSNHIQEYK